MTDMNTDNAGNVPAIGDTVAYNWQGQVAKGTIKAVGGNPLYPKTYEIDVEYPEFRRGKTSVVTNARNLLVIS